jgi:hypothetical protein
LTSATPSLLLLVQLLLLLLLLPWLPQRLHP